MVEPQWTQHVGPPWREWSAQQCTKYVGTPVPLVCVGPASARVAHETDEPAIRCGSRARRWIWRASGRRRGARTGRTCDGHDRGGGHGGDAVAADARAAGDRGVLRLLRGRLGAVQHQDHLAAGIDLLRIHQALGLRQRASAGAAERGLEALALEDLQCLHVRLADHVDRGRGRLRGGDPRAEQGDRARDDQAAAEYNKLLHVISVSRLRLRTYRSCDECETAAEASGVTAVLPSRLSWRLA
ncbi:hypothetical protein MSMEI_3587 [Mycolicibacterium smegmatis MC2 155]|uniref:Uncharacterized protein n=1 Tax=Mycolicibacterium smegmatis (strain ATCC 700084 / mc(2)155) TaxID=246196 RepID=I7FF03_MYCS2|nr:hypothetical protein MSMEI_3587 [Mycolicibacterium smegmatis MC2 155]